MLRLLSPAKMGESGSIHCKECQLRTCDGVTGPPTVGCAEGDARVELLEIDAKGALENPKP
jgi:hypothetical protein